MSMTKLLRNAPRRWVLTALLGIQVSCVAAVLALSTSANLKLDTDSPKTITVVEGAGTQTIKPTETGAPEGQPRRGMGVLVGRVTLGPLAPVQRGGDSRVAEGLPDAELVISNLKGQRLRVVVTDQNGGFRVSLPAGPFRIAMRPLSRGAATKDLPATVTIVEGQETRLDIRVDTGIR